MPGNIATIYLPLNTYAMVRCVTNAAFRQQITITPETGSPTVVTGSGEHDAPVPNGTFAIQTPGSSTNPLGYKVTVAVQSDNGSGGWTPSQVSQGSCSVMYYNLAMVVSEDYVDNDWNDAVVQFTWWTPPSARMVR